MPLSQVFQWKKDTCIVARIPGCPQSVSNTFLQMADDVKYVCVCNSILGHCVLPIPDAMFDWLVDCSQRVVLDQTVCIMVEAFVSF